MPAFAEVSRLPSVKYEGVFRAPNCGPAHFVKLVSPPPTLLSVKHVTNWLLQGPVTQARYRPDSQPVPGYSSVTMTSPRRLSKASWK